MTPIVIYFLWCVFWAYVNYRAISINQSILHWANGIIHIAVIAYFSISVSFILGAALFFEGRPVFDTFLNLFRGLGVGYVSRNPDSLLDKMEKRIFGNNGILPKIIYISLSAVFFIWYLI